MTPAQQTTLDLIKKLNTTEFDDWFDPSEVMAFVQVESGFRPHAYRYEPALGEGSYGLMQVLASTAKPFGVDNPETMYDPEVGLRTGMKVAKQYYETLQRKFGRDPVEEEWCDSYNRGPGGSQLGSDDHAYVVAWVAAWEHWKAQGVDA